MSALKERMEHEANELHLPAAGQAIVTEADLAPLPEEAQRHLRFMRVVGRPRDWSFEIGWTGLFRTGPKARWRRCEAWQYNHAPSVTRVFHLRLRTPISVIGRDTYVNGAGRMLVRPLDLFTLADERGPELDMAELVTYLNDALLIAPSMLLAPQVAWSSVDSASYEVTLTDRGRSVTGRMFLDHRGAPVNFSTMDRFMDDPMHRQLVRTRWTTPVSGWTLQNGRPMPRRARAVWHPDERPFVYADFRPLGGSLRFNVDLRAELIRAEHPTRVSTY